MESRVHAMLRSRSYRVKELICDAVERLVFGVAPQPTVGNDAQRRVLLVCKGNICRSPTAEGVLRSRLRAAGLAQCVFVDSAGTDVGQPGRKPDPRARWVAMWRGVSLGTLRARRLEPADVSRFDWIVVFDRMNASDVDHTVRMAGGGASVELLLGFRDAEIPDPVAGSYSDFKWTYEAIDEGCARLVERLARDVSRSRL